MDAQESALPLSLPTATRSLYTYNRYRHTPSTHFEFCYVSLALASMGPCFYEHGNSGRANAFGRNVLEACFRAVAKYGIRGAEILVETEPLSL